MKLENHGYIFVLLFPAVLSNPKDFKTDLFDP